MTFTERLFEGRINRRNYAIGMVLYVTFLATIVPLSSIIFPLSTQNGLFLAAVELLLATIFLFSLYIRRLHDMGKNWWYWEKGIQNIICLIKEGQNKKNKYGKQPEAKVDIKNLFGFS